MPICTLLLFLIRPLQVGPVSELDLHLTCPLPYQRNRTPVECIAVCSARFNPRSLAQQRSPHITVRPPCWPCSIQLLSSHGLKVPLSDLEHVTDPPWTRTLQKPKDKTIKPETMFRYVLDDENIKELLNPSGFQYNKKVSFSCRTLFYSQSDVHSHKTR